MCRSGTPGDPASASLMLGLQVSKCEATYRFFFCFRRKERSLCSWLSLQQSSCLCLNAEMMHGHTQLKDAFFTKRSLFFTLSEKKIITWPVDVL